MDPRLGVQSELQLLAYTIATAMRDLSHICSLHHSSRQCQILNLLSEARDRTCVLMDTSQICFPCVTMGTPSLLSSGHDTVMSILYMRKLRHPEVIYLSKVTQLVGGGVKFEPAKSGPTSSPSSQVLFPHFIDRKSTRLNSSH